MKSILFNLMPSFTKIHPKEVRLPGSQDWPACGGPTKIPLMLKNTGLFVLVMLKFD
jgi:hypothetical protein